MKRILFLVACILVLQSVRASEAVYNFNFYNKGTHPKRSIDSEGMEKELAGKTEEGIEVNSKSQEDVKDFGVKTEVPPKKTMI